jgi:hypothetical protein
MGRRRAPQVRDSMAFLPGLLLLASAAVNAATLKEDEPEIFTAGAIEIIDPWARGAIGEGHSAQVFFEFRNRGAAADRLLAARSPLARGATILYSAPGQRVEAIGIPEGGKSYELSQAGYSIELTDLEVPLTMGKRFALTLQFERAGALEVTVTSRFHSPQLARRIRDAARRGDGAALRRLREQ